MPTPTTATSSSAESTTMLQNAKPLQRELSELHSSYPIVDSMLRDMYAHMKDPNYTGDPLESLLRIKETWDMCEGSPPPVDIEPVFDIMEALHAEGVGSIAQLQQILDSSTDGTELEDESDFSQVLRLVKSIFAKDLGSGTEAVAGEPEPQPRLVTRRLQPARRQVDLKPKRLGPHGTWVNDPDAKELYLAHTTIVPTEKTITQQDTLTGTEGSTTRLRRRDTLTDAEGSTTPLQHRDTLADTEGSTTRLRRSNTLTD